MARSSLQNLFVYRLLGIVLAVLVYLLVPADTYPEAPAMAAVVTLMAIWWILEAVPIPVTSILPLFLFPLLGIQDMATTGAFYGKSTIFLFLGGFVLAIGLQETGLHKRIALRIVGWIGGQPRRLILGFMLATWFLSMWISNTATVMVMLPIALSILEQAKGQGNTGIPLFAIALMRGIAYAADMCGMATLVGTAPNVGYTTVFQDYFPEGPTVDFLAWFQMGFPLSISFVLLGWLLLVRVLFRIGKDNLLGSDDLVTSQLRALGPMRRDEWAAGLVFAAVALIWLTGSDLKLGGATVPGWRSLLDLKEVKDEAVAIAGAVALFLLPSRERPGQALLPWEQARNLPWGVWLLFGGGFAIAGGFASSGLSAMVGEQMMGLLGLGAVPLVLVVCLLLTILTEITSNTATTNLVLPILAQAGISLGLDPRILMVPATLSASCAFMMPVASPTQAIVFGSGYVPIKQMIRAGFWFNLLGILLVTSIFFLVGEFVLGIEWGVAPEWLEGTGNGLR